MASFLFKAFSHSFLYMINYMIIHLLYWLCILYLFYSLMIPLHIIIQKYNNSKRFLIYDSILSVSFQKRTVKNIYKHFLSLLALFTGVNRGVKVYLNVSIDFGTGSLQTLIDKKKNPSCDIHLINDDTQTKLNAVPSFLSTDYAKVWCIHVFLMSLCDKGANK